MGKILEMTDDIKRIYNRDAEKHPWMKTTMSDDELCRLLAKDYDEDYANRLHPERWNLHYGYVYLAVIKHFYETGEMVNYDCGYIDGQAETITMTIMENRGATEEEISQVVCKKSKFDFAKYPEHTGVCPPAR